MKTEDGDGEGSGDPVRKALELCVGFILYHSFKKPLESLNHRSDRDVRDGASELRNF